MQGTTSLVEEGEVCLLSVPRPGVSPATRYKVNVMQCSSVLTGKLNLRWGVVGGYKDTISGYKHQPPNQKPPQLTNAGEGVEKRVPSYTVGGNVN